MRMTAASAVSETASARSSARTSTRARTRPTRASRPRRRTRAPGGAVAAGRGSAPLAGALDLRIARPWYRPRPRLDIAPAGARLGWGEHERGAHDRTRDAGASRPGEAVAPRVQPFEPPLQDDRRP